MSTDEVIELFKDAPPRTSDDEAARPPSTRSTTRATRSKDAFADAAQGRVRGRGRRHQARRPLTRSSTHPTTRSATRPGGSSASGRLTLGLRGVNTSATRTLRAGLTAAAFLGLAACGGIADDAPTDADPTAFCHAYYDEEATAQDVADRARRHRHPRRHQRRRAQRLRGLRRGPRTTRATCANKDVSTVQIPADDQADGKAFVDLRPDLCTPLLAADRAPPRRRRSPASPSTEPPPSRPRPASPSESPTS